jgi:hypothetical protein
VLFSIEQGEKKGRPPTLDQLAFLESEPVLDAGLAIMCRAYVELSTCRSNGMSIGPISWLAMVEWARYHELDRHITDHLIRVLRLVDAETLRRAAERVNEKK